MCHLRATASVRLVVMTSAWRGLRPEANPPASTRQPWAAPTRPRSLMEDSAQLLGQYETPILNFLWQRHAVIVIVEIEPHPQSFLHPYAAKVDILPA